mgnify:CR=1 FL=1
MHTNIDEMGYKDEKYEEKREEYTDSWEGVAGVRDEHTGLSNCPIPNCHTLDEPGRPTHGGFLISEHHQVL